MMIDYKYARKWESDDMLEAGVKRYLSENIACHGRILSGRISISFLGRASTEERLDLKIDGRTAPLRKILGVAGYSEAGIT